MDTENCCSFQTSDEDPSSNYISLSFRLSPSSIISHEDIPFSDNISIFCSPSGNSPCDCCEELSINSTSPFYHSSRNLLETTGDTPISPSLNHSILPSFPSRLPGRKSKITKNKEKKFPFSLDCHDNKKDDNMIKKIKPHYHCFLLKYINNCIKKMGMKTYLKKLEGKFNSDISITKNKVLLETSLSHVLSEDISKRFVNFNKDYNKKIITEIMNKNKYKYLKGLLELNYEYVYTNVFIKQCETCYDNIYIDYFKNEIPKDFLFDKLVDKQDNSLQKTLETFGKERFVWKIKNGVSRSRKTKPNDNIHIYK